MCPFVIVVIMIALILFMPAVYAMGVTRGIVFERLHECSEGAEGGKSDGGKSESGTAGTPSVQAGTPDVMSGGAKNTLQSTQTATKCTRCAKMKYCIDPTPEMAVFCM